MKTAMNSLYGKIGAKAVPSQTNGGVVCDAPNGEVPCACGAWHVKKEKEAETILRGVLDQMGMGSVGSFEGAEAIETALADLQKQVRDLQEKLATEERSSQAKPDSPFPFPFRCEAGEARRARTPSNLLEGSPFPKKDLPFRRPCVRT